MKKYKITVTETCIHESTYSVLANSEEEARDLIETGDGNLDDSNYDTTDQIDFESIEPVE